MAQYPTIGTIHRYDAALDALLDTTAKIEIIAQGFTWSEGPVWVKKGGYLCGHDYLCFDWYGDPNYAENKKDKFIWSTEGDYMGVFGVNPAVDEFCQKYGYDLNVTKEWFGSWYIKK